MIQLQQAVIDGALANLRTVDREQIKNAFAILNNLMGNPFPISVSTNTITIGASEYQTVESDSANSVQNREKKGCPPVSDKYASIASSTLNVDTGATTGDFASGQSGLPSMTQDYYVATYFELRSNKKWYVKFGTPVASKVDALSTANLPAFSGTAAVKKAVWILQKDTGSGDWNFKNPLITDMIELPSGAGGGGSGTDLVPSFKDSSNYTVNPTGGNKARLNNKYFYLNESFDKAFTVSADGTWYINIDTSLAEGELTTSYVVNTQVAPSSASFNSKYAVIGEYVVASGVVTSLVPYSTREMVSWINGLPNIKQNSETRTAAGDDYSFTHGLNATPDLVLCDYYVAAEDKFYPKSEQQMNVDKSGTTTVTYSIPVSDEFPFAVGDYFQVKTISYNSNGSGFASPKSDDSTDWYTSTPATTITHALGSIPVAITLEFFDVTNNIYYHEDGADYIDKSTGGKTASNVTFDWTGLDALSATLKMKIRFHLSKISAGAFEASASELGTVKVTGGSTVAITPDLILDSSHTSFASQVNALSDYSFVYVKESITTTAQQTITKKVKWLSAYGAKIITATNMTSMVKFSAQPHIMSICLEAQADVTNAIEFDANFRCDSASFIVNGSGKTLTNTVTVNTGYKGFVNGLSEATLGTITNIAGTDVDGNSSINII